MYMCVFTKDPSVRVRPRSRRRNHTHVCGVEELWVNSSCKRYALEIHMLEARWLLRRPQ